MRILRKRARAFLLINSFGCLGTVLINLPYEEVPDVELKDEVLSRAGIYELEQDFQEEL